jgi:hypothetical protein
LTVKTLTPSDVGIHKFILKAKLAGYSTPGFFPQTTAFTVTVTESSSTTILSPKVETKYNYTIG